MQYNYIHTYIRAHIYIYIYTYVYIYCKHDGQVNSSHPVHWLSGPSGLNFPRQRVTADLRQSIFSCPAKDEQPTRNGPLFIFFAVGVTGAEFVSWTPRSRQEREG